MNNINEDEAISVQLGIIKVIQNYINGEYQIAEPETKKYDPEKIITEYFLYPTQPIALAKSVGIPENFISHGGSVSYKHSEFHRLLQDPQCHIDTLSNINIWSSRAFSFYKNWSGRSIEDLKNIIGYFYKYVCQVLARISAVSFINTTYCDIPEVADLINGLEEYKKNYEKFATKHLDSNNIDRLGLLKVCENDLTNIKQIVGKVGKNDPDWYLFDILIPLYLKDILEQSNNEETLQAAYDYVLNLGHNIVTPRDMKFALNSIVLEDNSRYHGEIGGELYDELSKAATSDNPGLILDTFCNLVETGKLLLLMRDNPYIVNIKTLNTVNRYMVEQKLIKV